MTQATTPQQRALRRFTRAIEQRGFLGEDRIATHALNRRMGSMLDDLATTSVPDSQRSAMDRPPRRVAVAMAMALYTQPHLSTTFRSPPPEDIHGSTTPRLADPSLVVSNDVLEESLGLTKWELDDLREEVDRRAGGVLKQRMLIAWLSSRFGMPGPGAESLFRVLFPGVPWKGADLVHRGGQLYAVVPQPAGTPLGSLYLSTAPQPSGTRPPTQAFRARYVDPSLLRSMARGIGLEAEQASELLERTVTIIPEDRAAAFLRRDHWRAGGFAQVTHLGTPYSTGAWLTRPLAHADLQWHEWMSVENGKLKMRRPARVFDAFMAQRAHALLTQRYADMVAECLTSDRATGRASDATCRYTFHEELTQLAQPMLDWAESAATHRPIAQFLSVDVRDVEAALYQIGQQWRARLKSWTQPTGDDRLHGTISQLVTRVSCFDGALRAQYHREADPRWAHQDILLLFAGHYVVESPFDRTLLSATLDTEHAGQAIAEWFWPTWMRVLNALEDEASTTNSGFITFQP